MTKSYTQIVWKTCDTCTRRHCKMKPREDGICTKKIQMKEGFPMGEMLNDKSDSLPRS